MVSYLTPPDKYQPIVSANTVGLEPPAAQRSLVECLQGYGLSEAALALKLGLIQDFPG